MDESNPKGHQHRKPYEPPVVVEIGPLVEVTHGAGPGSDALTNGSL